MEEETDEAMLFRALADSEVEMQQAVNQTQALLQMCQYIAKRRDEIEKTAMIALKRYIGCAN